MITKIIQEEKIQKAKKYVEKGESFVIVTHVSPDGDALGSSLGLYHFLSAYGKDNVAVVVPNAFPSFYRWMPGAKDVVIHEKYPDFAEKLIKEADVIFCLDFNEPKRIEKLAPAVIASEGRFMLTYAELYAPVLGLGSCWAGWAEAAAISGDPGILEVLNLPPGRIVTGAIVVGIPRYRHRRIPARRPLAVSWGD